MVVLTLKNDASSPYRHHPRHQVYAHSWQLDFSTKEKDHEKGWEGMEGEGEEKEENVCLQVCLPSNQCEDRSHGIDHFSFSFSLKIR